MEARRIQARGLGFSVERRGTGVPFLWTHGMSYSMAADEEAGLFDWGSLTDRATVIRYDARGHGDTDASGEAADYTWPSLAEDAVAIARSLGVQRWIAAGASMGAGVSLTAAVRHAEQVLGLVLVTPPTAWESRPPQVATYRLLRRLARWRVLSAVFPLLLRSQQILPGPLSSAAPASEARYRREMSSLENRVYAALYGGAAASDFPAKEEVAAIAVPTLILAWSGDPNHPLSAAQELKRLIPGARLEIADSMAEVRAWPGLVRAFVQQLAPGEARAAPCDRPSPRVSGER